jgi:hypothetical protein
MYGKSARIVGKMRADTQSTDLEAAIGRLMALKPQSR